MTEPLRFTTDDADRVEETWQQFAPSAALHRVDPDRFRFTWFSAELAWFSLVKYDLRAGVQSMVEPQDQLLACRVDGTDAHVGTGDTRFADGTPWLTDGTRMEAQWDAASVTALIFDAEPAQGLARRMCGDDSLRLRVLDHTADRKFSKVHWSHTIDFISAGMRNAGGDDLVMAGLRRQALWLTLTEFPTTFRNALAQDPQTRAAPATVRRALSFIEEHAHLPITIDDIAEAVHISTRGLQYAFRRALDSTPAEQLRRARLAGARGELLAGTNDTIAVVARRWGFAHPSRFSAAYREEYGMLPADTHGRRRASSAPEV